MLHHLAEAVRFRSVVYNFVRTTLVVRYKRSVLGYLWTVLSPVIKYAIIGYVFENLGKFNMSKYYGFMFLGSIFFGFVAASLSATTLAFVANENYIKKIYVPKLIFVLNSVLNELANFICVFIGIALMLLGLGEISLSWTWLCVPLSLVIAAIGLAGFGLILATATIWFRDLTHILDILLQALFFATPIMFPVTFLDKAPLIRDIAMYNPLYYYVELFREPLLNGRIPFDALIITSSISIVFFIVGLLILERFNNRIVFRL